MMFYFEENSTFYTKFWFDENNLLIKYIVYSIAGYQITNLIEYSIQEFLCIRFESFNDAQKAFKEKYPNFMNLLNYL